MISVAEALDHLFDLATQTGTEAVPLREAAGRVLREDAVADRDQPPFAASSMDGYAISAEAGPGDSFRVVGEAAAGHAWDGSLGAQDALRIFTGAPVPAGAARVVIQEDVTREGDTITLSDKPDPGPYIRPRGNDFAAGSRLTAPRRLRPAELALLASMNVAEVTVARRPRVALLATGDELRMPGEDPGPEQIIASNIFGLAAMFEAAGAKASILPIARDTLPSLRAALALAEGTDLLVTIGGASVGDHDLVAQAVGEAGMERSFYKVAMRPGKPLMAGRMGAAAMIGLPGNPVSALVCGEVFVRPVLDAMLGLPAAPRPRATLPLTAPLPANGPREHYMRATLTAGGVAAFERQDSALLSVLATADALIVRPPGDPARATGDEVEVIRL